MTWNPITLTLPGWLEDIEREPRSTIAERMEFVIGMARTNVERHTGGPFAAAIFESDSGRLVAPGVNRVVPTSTSFAHAEIMAIGVANQALQHFDLGAPDLPDLELVASTEPCALCLGATVWAGVAKVITGARDEDARAIGFDEGPKVEDWVGALNRRGIEVVTDVKRAGSVEVLREYQESGEIIYNGRRDA